MQVSSVNNAKIYNLSHEKSLPKLVFLHIDRCVEFHSQHNCFYKTRIPKFGWDFSYHYPSCDLYFVGASSEVFRLNLEQGRFLFSLQTDAVVEGLPSVSALKFNCSLGVALGTSTGQVKTMANTFAYEDYRKDRIRQKIEESRAQRVQLKAVANLLTDDRFKVMFKNPDYQVDERSEEFVCSTPSCLKWVKRGARNSARLFSTRNRRRGSDFNSRLNVTIMRRGGRSDGRLDSYILTEEEEEEEEGYHVKLRTDRPRGC
ncbi:hypothetical protein cypCar_00004408 [Cyprinus carpio]|nr:hypothetical protein cypCar_00004408 [Cyprinus carpio]